MIRILKLVRDAIASRLEVIHDANDYLMSDPLNGIGIPSSFPAFEEAMNSYYRGPKIKRTPDDSAMSKLVDGIEARER